ncbi:PPC domain-containing DNA-binding protein [Kosmotoga pacifica]|uniref:DNA-binding protein n=1 Tax=Kosmotoga pacifica TaxID=1330330 RepID=A0A0G2ZGY6_9BACT|nr:PPC domain-containing DNA-binding protein [Kosmotoga pacifica]AKI98018.1 DNA-binding protein [Kosmotoga pacifica]
MIYRETDDILFVRLDNHEDFYESLQKVLVDTGTKSGIVINGIGMLRDFELGWFNIQCTRYEKKRYSMPHELLSLQGNIALKNGEIFIHLHASLAGPSNEAFGGHLFGGAVCNTAEIFILKTPGLSLKRGEGELFNPLI